MTEKTEKKIMNSALRIFAANGYYGATTRLIASESGFSEVTLFRKFETKDNLFKIILTTNQEKILKELDSILDVSEYGDSKEFLRVLVDGTLNLINDNYDFIKIIMNEKCDMAEMALKTVVNDLET